MNKITNTIVNHTKIIIISFSVLIIICGILMTGVKMNTDNTGYLPDDINSKQALLVLKEEFGVLGTAQIMIKSDDLIEIMNIKKQIEDIEGVRSVLWLDNFADIKVPLSHIAEEYKDSFYRDGYALMQIEFTGSNDSEEAFEAIDEIEKLMDGDIYLAGAAVSSHSFLSRSRNEMPIYMIIALVLILGILLLSTESWIEPILFLGAIGVAIIINMGTNIFISGGLSNMTMSAASILQLAVSLDYAIFLLHRFHDERNDGKGVKEAMVEAMKKAAPAVFGSAFTTIAGFLALMVMDFGIGRELGIVLAKGVAISLITIIVLLPALVIVLDKAIEKLKHRSFLGDFKRFSRFSIKFRWVAIALLVLLSFVFFNAGNRVEFYYSDKKALPETDIAYIGSEKIEEIYGNTNANVIIVPGNDPLKQKNLEIDLMKLDGVESVVGLYSQTGVELNDILLPQKLVEQFTGENYSQMLLYFKLKEVDSDEVFLLVENTRLVLEEHYDEWYIAGEAFSYYDLKNVTEADNVKANLLAIILVALVIAVVFKSFGIPLAAVIVIESAIYINLGIAYFLGTPTSFISSMVISAIQLGATIDYAVLYVSRYKEIRRKGIEPMAASRKALSEVFPSILTSAGILMAATFSIYFISTVAMVSELCLLIGRGAFISMLLVTLVLPGLLAVLDKFIILTSWKWLGNSKNIKRSGKANEEI